MKIYPDTERELTMADYKPLPSLHGLHVAEIEELIYNLENALENAWLSGDDFMAMAIEMDIRKAEIYYKLYSKKARKEGE